MELILNILRGVLIGIANVIPGVSGGTMMVSMGIYDDIITSISHLFSRFKKSVATLWPYILGMAVGIGASVVLISWLFQHYPLPTNTAFIGLVLGGMPVLLKRIDRKRIGVLGVLLFAAFFAAIILLEVFGRGTSARAMTPGVGTALLMLALGAVASATMIIPGVSGSMVLMALGYYETVIGQAKALVSAAVHSDFAAMGAPLLTLIPFGIGVVIGLFFVAKLIEVLLRRWQTLTCCAIFGLVAASPVVILMNTSLSGVTVVIVLVSLVTFAAGFLLALRLGREKQPA